MASHGASEIASRQCSRPSSKKNKESNPRAGKASTQWKFVQTCWQHGVTPGTFAKPSCPVAEGHSGAPQRHIRKALRAKLSRPWSAARHGSQKQRATNNGGGKTPGCDGKVPGADPVASF